MNQDDKNILADTPDDKTIGSVYKRSFIEMYNIHFSEEGSYANEDYGFSRACKIIINYLEREWHFHTMSKHIKIPVFYEHIDMEDEYPYYSPYLNENLFNFEVIEC